MGSSSQKHNWLHLALIVTSCLAFVLTAIFNGLATAGVQGVFNNDTGAVADKYFVEMTPHGWVFSTVWTIIYIYQVMFLGYSVSQIFRKPLGQPDHEQMLYCSEYGVSIWVYVLYPINMLLNLSWLLIWDRGHIWPGWVVITALQIVLYLILFFLIRSPVSGWEYSLRASLAITPIAIYAAWLSIAPLINFAACLSYGGPNLAQTDSSTVSLVLLLLLLIVWFPCELYVFRTKFYPVFNHFIPLILAPIGILTKMRDPTNRNFILAIIILVVALIALIVKIGYAIYGCVNKDCKENKCEVSPSNGSYKTEEKVQLE